MVSKSALKGPDIHIVDPLVEWTYFGIKASGVHVVSSLAVAHTGDYKFKADFAEVLFIIFVVFLWLSLKVRNWFSCLVHTNVYGSC